MSDSDYQEPSGTTHSVAPLAAWGWDRYQRGRGQQLGPEGGDSPEDELPHRPDQTIARVVGHQHHHYELVCAPDARPASGRVSGAFSYRAAGPADYPTVGDWVWIDPTSGTIHELLPRTTAISRNSAGEETVEQVIVANIDVVLLVFAIDGSRGFTVGLVERAVTAAWNSGARPVIVLNKSDLADDATQERMVQDAESAAPGVEIFLVSAHSAAGVDALAAAIAPDETVGMLGKSGVGKSALLNAIGRANGVELSIREGALRHGDRQGRHTTTDKHLYRLPNGPIIADVPGLRELQLWADQDKLDETFPEIEELARECRFNDCSHNGEPGCRIAAALTTGELPNERYERYRELQRELAFLARRKDQRAREEEQMKWKKIAQHIREVTKRRRE
jgi:ribosome biogenesis GTPase